jgi:hypothetical protein
MSFLEYLTEAQYGASSFPKVMEILVKRAEKALGQKLYQYGGDGKQKIVFGNKNYDSYLYLMTTGKAIRFNTFRYQIESIEIWKKGYSENGSDFIIDVGELNSVQFTTIYDKIIVPQIMNPTSGTKPIYFLPENFNSHQLNLVEAREYLTEAKRITPLDWYQACMKRYNTHVLYWDQINALATEMDVQVPTYVRGQKQGKHIFSVLPPGVNQTTNAVENKAELDNAEKKGVEPILFVKITPQDPVTKKFLPAAESKEAQNLYKRIQDMTSNVTSPNYKPTDEERVDVNTLYGHLTQLVKGVAKGAFKSLLVAGGPGTGKTFTIMQTIKEAGLKNGTDYIKFSGKATASSVYQIFFKWRKGGLIVFDDLDNIWKDGDAVNLLKAALDSYDERWITWSSGRTVDVSRMTDEDRENFYDELEQQIEDDPGSSKIKYPNMFPFEGRVIFISNMKEKDFDTAILSRSTKINMDITPQELLERIKSMMAKLGGEDISIELKQELLDYLMQRVQSGKITQLTMREFVKGCQFIRSGIPNWKELLKYS